MEERGSTAGWPFPPRVRGTIPPMNDADTVTNPLVGVIMGSQSDWETMQHAAETLATLGVSHECRVVSAHRTPDLLFEYAASAADRGIRVIIAGAGGAAVAGVDHQAPEARVRAHAEEDPRAARPRPEDPALVHGHPLI